ncbi:MAG: ABC transporter substrate-binding protein, partial [Verrucomicrobiota bacterium]
GFDGPLLGGDGWEAPELVGVAGAAADGAFFPVHFSLEDPAGRTREFGRRFEARFGRTPTGVSALGYDALQLIADAIRRAGSAEPAAIRSALAATRGFDGLTGRIVFDDAREVRKPAAIIEVRGGRFRFLRMVTP